MTYIYATLVVIVLLAVIAKLLAVLHKEQTDRKNWEYRK